MRLGALFSGGKDSTFALFKARSEGHEIACLISLVSENPESYMFHTPNIHLVEMQAECLEIPLILKETKGEKEKELIDLKNAILEAKKKYKIEGIVTGAVASNYQKERIQKICDELSLRCVNPLWGINPEQYWNEILNNEFKVIISGIAAEGLGKEWLGIEADKENFKKLKELSKKFHFSLAFEGGEAETTVLDCPLFQKKIEIIDSEIKFKDNSGVYLIKRAKLEKK